ncbi:pentatricopeptide repeat-containing protein At1g08070, chloroplastic-like [Ananas comosus]|uniref:Pentatricopeptide repeat-containing protein At1g08070, chloroplastic-like n=1 Tax=Ananas comosus TaxID=4615 RepID=A0A6P5GVU5_ANACO|nr:pentatricopeptide repeat-containing protein At1g08070, chloroplastic-like [Ananas comosus]XP_020111936.1 pentatricopeptide repeat-containing protein At1g08070, chloroplastic-like [Ananas comosus]XP_020111937.1 pentatricopeptide repeat-containing protein At1g08070, chloroplastic-like [Ananas comosus]XP_020111938.1 pentatricopeptide repeat-containing protein At1g08070, chloroplastic-like [Ananas comosus]XP_020111939.1 pentatricopeptide repeat-containing protein At1g08070, chloroplastic-like [A
MAAAPLTLPAYSIPIPPLSLHATDPKTLLLEHCRSQRDVRQVHARLIKTGCAAADPSAIENLLESAALVVPDALDYALAVFRRSPAHLLRSQSYNILVRAFIRSRSPDDALLLFLRMLARSVPPDPHTFSCILKACSRMNSVRHGRMVHARILKCGLGSEEFVRNSLVHMYASCGEVGLARALFDRMPHRGIVTWNAMFAGYFKAGAWGEVVELFRYMSELRVAFDDVTLISVLTACGRLGALDLGERIDEYVERNRLKSNRNLVTSLVDMYAKCGKVGRARELFDEMPYRDVVAWSAMISGYTQSDQCREALALFHEMQIAKVEPNEVTMVSVLSSCAVLGALETGKWVHSYIKRKQLHLTVNLGTALVDFYAKCGCIESATEAFAEMRTRNAWTWTVLIRGLASNGKGKDALLLFSSMLEAKFEPTDVTFVGVLSACSHAGLVKEGREFFNSMSRDFGIEPRIEHYGCLVDILGRAGLLQEAYQFIKNMPIEPNAVVWRTLLASCKIHKNVEIAEECLKQIVRLEPRHSGDYVLLSSTYASAGRWEDAVRVRNLMKEKGIEKIPGCSLIELDGIIFEFFAEDSAHPQSKEIYDEVEEMMAKIKVAGYIPNVADARLDAEDDEKEVSISHHSEKLAIAFGLINSPAGATIRLSKNLRVCTDCHVATKLISKVYGREIVVRDRNRFHHFKDGFCSCNDYW